MMVKVIMVIFDLRTRNDINEHGIILTNTNLTNLTNNEALKNSCNS